MPNAFKFLRISLVRLIAVASLAAPAIAQPAVEWNDASPDGSAGVPFTIGGTERREVLDAFDPQPDPPSLPAALFVRPIRPAFVPEPATWALMGLGFAAIGSLVAFARRQKAGRKDDDR